MPTMKELAASAAFQLVGTCKGLYELGEQYEALENDKEFCAELDAIAFCCEGCSWWSGIEDLHNERPDERWLCEECSDNENDGEDECQ